MWSDQAHGHSTPVKYHAPVTSTPDVLGIAELTRRWGITRERIWQLVRAEKIPPGQLLDSGRVWARADIEAYEATPDGQARLARKDQP